MKRLIFFTIIALTALSLYACSSCPVPPSTPRTYSLNTAPAVGTQK